MVAEWYCEIEGQQQGPLTAVQLKQLATAGKLQPTHSIWKQGMEKRVPARAVKGLFDAAGGGKKTGLAPGNPASGVKPATKEEEIVETELEEVVETEHVEEVVETLEAVQAAPKKPPAPELIAETPAVYREGIPDLDGPITGVLNLETTGLCFLYEDDEGEEIIRIPFAKLDNVLEPAKGDFPPAMKNSALKAKVAGKAGKLASGLVGNWLGGTAGDVTSKLGKAASSAAEASGDLGKPPRNRLTVMAHVRRKRCKIYFDMAGDSREEMEDEAKHFHKKIQTARDKASVAQAEPGTTNINVLVHSAGAPGRGPAASGGPSAAPPTAGKPFRVLSGSNVQGPFSLEEIRRLLAAGKVGAGDMIGVESWLPVATLAGILGAGAKGGTRSGSGAAFGAAAAAGLAGKIAGASAADGEEETEEEVPEMDVEPEAEEEPAEEPAKSPAFAEGDAPIPMDDDFNL